MLQKEKKIKKTNVETDEDVLFKPDVIIDFSLEKELLFISIKNIGNRPAYKVKSTFEQKFFDLERKEISSYPLFRNIEFLSPGKEIKTMIDNFSSYILKRQPLVVKVRVDFLGDKEKPFSNTIVHDLNIFRDLKYIP